MKVILNDDVKHVGEMGDVKNVANGYARNYLFPRMLAVPYTDETVAYFEGKKAEIEARKEQKRNDSKSTKEKLEALNLELVMPAGNNGKLFGAVTSQTLVAKLAELGFDIERKKIEVPGSTIKSVGSYSVKIHLYETTVAEVNLSVKAQEVKSEKTEKPAKEAKKEASSDGAESAKAE